MRWVECPCCGSQASVSSLPSDDDAAEVCDRFDMERQGAFLFLFFWKAKGRTITRNQLHDFLESLMHGRAMSPGAVNTAVKRVRRCLKQHNAPIEIQTLYGLGYRLTCKEQNWSWK